MFLGCNTPEPGSESAAPERSAATPAQGSERDARGVVLFVGTSLTAGYGLGAEFAYPALIQQKIDSVGLPFRVVNAGVSGETSAGGLRRIDWYLQQPIQILVLELGANDALRGLNPADMKANLDSIIRHTRTRYPDAAIVLAGMEAPPNLGDAYTSQFRAAFTDLARTHNAVLIPFLLEGVAGVAELNQSDGIHPTVEGQQIMATTVWKAVEPVLQATAAQPKEPSRP